jgi:protein SCO1/2
MTSVRGSQERRPLAGCFAGVSPAVQRTADQPPRRRRSFFLAALVTFATVVTPAQAQTTSKDIPANVALQQRLDTQLPLDLMFRDESGQVVRLSKYFGKKPVLINFMYYRCPMLCSMVMEGISSSLSELKFTVGTEFDVITVSIDPRDRPRDARLMKDKYVKRYGRMTAEGGWHFLTGHETAIKTLANAAGFIYSYDLQSDQFGHAAALLVITPDGRISRYFSGFEYKPRDVRLALVEASRGKVGNAVDQVLLLCYHYDPATGKYSRNAMNFVRAGGLATIFTLGGFIVIMIRREKKGGEA